MDDIPPPDEPIVIANDIPDEADLQHMWKYEDAICGPTDMLAMWRDWVKATAPRYNPWVGLYSAITTFGCLLGGRVRGHMGCSPNIYSLIMMPTGGGKMVAHQHSWEFLDAMGMSSLYGPSTLENMDKETAKRGGDIIWGIDEFHTTMRLWRKGAGKKISNAKHFLLESYSGEPWRGYDKTGEVTIPRPHPNILALCQPAMFSSELAKEMLTNGTLGRFLCYIESGLRPLRVAISQEGKSVRESLPPELIQMAQERMPDKLCGGEPILKMRYVQEDTQRIEDLAAKVDAAHLAVTNDYAMSACRARDWEKICKLAMIHSFTSKLYWYKIGYESFEWAYAVVEKSTRELISYIYKECIRNPIDKDVDRIVRWCTGGRKTFAYLEHHAKNLDRFRLNQVVNIALQRGLIVELRPVIMLDPKTKKDRKTRSFVAKTIYDFKMHGRLKERKDGPVQGSSEVVRQEPQGQATG